MKSAINYTDEKMDDVRIIPDFLPSPKELAFREETVKVTISLSKSSIDFFKNQSEKYNTSYQKMIRKLLDKYVGMQKSA